MDGVAEPGSPTPPTGHQHQSGHLMCYEGRTSSRALDTVQSADVDAPAWSSHAGCVGACLGQLAMDQFDHILNWTLQPGSHPFPGKDGGTCINEAAIVAAGFPPPPVRGIRGMAACL